MNHHIAPVYEDATKCACTGWDCTVWHFPGTRLEPPTVCTATIIELACAECSQMEGAWVQHIEAGE